ncbi:MAG: radical SAM protein [Candidatus Gastranaerophilales bacterium]|nr:radical SAM protein [Candidatus Gastranaerophilales bacterium]
MELNVFKIIKNTKVEGFGNRFCIWVQGCSKHCKGCYASETWSFEPKQLIDIDILFEMIKNEKNIDGVTFLGGEPFEQVKALSVLAQKVQSIGLGIITFTGQNYDDLKQSDDKNLQELLKNTDLLIDGEFIEEKQDFSRAWVGSSNQRYIFLSGKYNEKMLSSYKNKIEVRINKDGTIFANGMGDFTELEKKLGLQRIYRVHKDV